MRYGALIAAVISILLSGLLSKKLSRFSKPQQNRDRIALAMMPVVSILTSVWLVFRFPPEQDATEIWKMAAFLPVFWLIAYNDQKQKRIFNEYLLLCLGMRAGIFIAELVQNGSGALSRLIAEFIWCGILLAFGFLFRFLSKGGFGMGDVKLLGILPFMMGTDMVLNGLFLGMLIIFGQAVICLLLKLKGKKDVLPFAPALGAGMWLSMIICAI